MEQIYAFFGALSYEFRMQIRRWPVWAAFAILVSLLFLAGGSPSFKEPTTSLSQYIAFTAFQFNIFVPIVAGIFLADRLPRDRRTHVDEVLNTMPGGPGARFFGKFVGCTLATLVPLFCLYAIHMGRLIFLMQQAGVLPPNGLPTVLLTVLAAFAGMVLPGILFVSAFSLACTTVIWVPLYQFLFICYWFWGNLLPANRGIPTLSGTMLTPIGTYPALGFFNKAAGPVKQATALQATESILLLLGLAILALLVAWRYQAWRQYQ